MKKQYKLPELGLFLEEVYVERNEMPCGKSKLDFGLKIVDMRLTSEFSRARGIYNKELQKCLETKGFEAIEVLGKVKVERVDELRDSDDTGVLKELNDVYR